MSLSQRDKAIINDLNMFRCMDRDSIAQIHFSGLRNPLHSANNVLKRLHRDGHIQRSTQFTPFVYFGQDVTIKKNSQKINHFLGIVDVYKQILKFEQPKIFLVEPKYGEKGTVEPDAFTIFRAIPFFVEVQKSAYSEKVMFDKLDRYEELVQSGIINNETWQRKDKKIFPKVLILSDTRYAIDNKYSFKIYQAQSIDQFMEQRNQMVNTASANEAKFEYGEITSNLRMKPN